MSAEIEARTVSVKGAAAALDISTWQVYALLDGGDLDGIRVGRRRLVVVASIDAYVQRLVDAESPARSPRAQAARRSA